MLCSDGAHYVVEAGGAHLLLDAIAIAQAHVKAVQAEDFQPWIFRVNADRTAVLTCEDGNERVVYRQEIQYTDFPLEEIKFNYCNKIIHLPSEY